MNKKLLVLSFFISFVFIYFFPIGQLRAQETQKIVQGNLQERLRTVYSLNASLVKENKELISRCEEAHLKQNSLLNEVKLLTLERDKLRERFKAFNQMKEELEFTWIDLGKLDKENKNLKQILISTQEKLSRTKEELSLIKRDKELLAVAQRERNYYKDMAEDCQAKTSEEREEFLNIKQENKRLRQEVVAVHYNLGNLFFEHAKYDEAVIEYERALSLPQSHYNLAAAYSHLGKYEKAISCLRAYLSSAPELTSEQKKEVQEEIIRLQYRAKVLTR